MFSDKNDDEKLEESPDFYENWEFKLRSDFKPTGDQPTAIEALVDGINSGLKHQVLLGVTGSGKTYIMANIVQNLQRPTLVLAHNKTLAAQLFSEFISRLYIS